MTHTGKTCFKFAAVISMVFTLSFSSLAQERPALVIAVDNLWETMDPVIGISTTGA